MTQAFVRPSAVPNRVYLGILAAIGPTEILARAIFGGEILVRGHTLAVVLPIALLGGAIIAWVLDGRPQRASVQLLFVAGIATLIWIFTLLREQAGGIGYNFAAFILVTALFMIALKPPDFASARTAMDVLVLGLALAAIIGTVLAIAGYPLSNQFAPARNFLGVGSVVTEYRWVGVFETTTQASAVGSYLVLYGIWRRGVLFLSVAILGGLILVAGGSRGAVVATVCGLLVVIWIKNQILGIRMTTRLRMLITLMLIVIASLGIWSSDPTMSGRTPIWSAYVFELFPVSPWLGLGTSQLDTLVAQNVHLSRLSAMTHAHNLMIDVGARYGVLGLLLVIALLTYALFLGFKAGKFGLWIAPALMVALITNQLSDIHIDWRYLDYDYAILLFSIVLASSFLNSREPAGKNPHKIQPP